MLIKPSLCCISLNLQKNGIRANTMTKKRFLMLERKESVKILSTRVCNNLRVVYETLKYCVSKNWNYRISSDIFPLATLPEANLNGFYSLPDASTIDLLFSKCKDIIQSTKIRCSMHPDQFVVPASFNLNTVEKSIKELCHHAEFMDHLGLPYSYESPINIHMNIYKGDIKQIAQNFKNVYNDLPHNVKSRLVLENEDKPNSWSVQELYDNFYQKLGIPITYDNLHFKCNPKQLTANKALNMCIESWQNTKPLFHFSDNDPNNKNPRAHADYVSELADEYKQCNIQLDLDFEFKAKDLAISKFEENYAN
jgi:UV DNA damage endonuclease